MWMALEILVTDSVVKLLGGEMFVHESGEVIEPSSAGLMS
jgi:hypothetical protein